MELNKKDNNAITLVALIITIIILLILAGITISQLSNSGLFDKSKTAKEKSENAQADESEKIAKYENEINGYIDANRGTITLTEEQYNALVKKTTAISIHTPSNMTTGTWVKIADYPQGYNFDNCYIDAGYLECYGYKYYMSASDTSYWTLDLQARQDGLYILVRGNDNLDQNGKIILTKY